MPIMLRLATMFFVLLVTTGSASAATTWYTVELIAFQHLSGDGFYGENWPSTPGEPAVHNAIRLAPSSELALEDETEQAGSSVIPFAYQLLGQSSFQLTDVSNRLKWSDGYRPLLHIAWRQPGLSKSSSKTIYVHSALPNRFRNDATAADGLAGASELEGTIRVSRSRYLHVDVDLVHFRRAPVGSKVDATQFRLQQSRRLRSKEMHYIDHPLFGLIVLITPYEPAEIFSEEQAQSSE